MRRKIYQYYVEGECEKRLIEVLKSWNGCNGGLAKSGKVSIFNPVDELFTEMRLRQLEEGTTVILIFDTDVGDASILKKNIRILSEHKRIKNVWLIPQVKNLEEELCRCTDIRDILELLPSKSRSNFSCTGVLYRGTVLMYITQKEDHEVCIHSVGFSRLTY